MSTPQRERRSFLGLELRAAAEGSDSPGTIVGYAAVFNRLSGDLGGFREQLKPGAFTRTLKDCDCIAFVDHEGQVLGRNVSGTLRLSQDEVGLRFELDLPDTTLGRDTAVLLARGDYRGCSFAFIAVVDQWDFSGQTAIRTLVDCDLYDVSVVGRPAYPDTTVALRSLEAGRASAAPPAPEVTPSESPGPATLAAFEALIRLEAAS